MTEWLKSPWQIGCKEHAFVCDRREEKRRIEPSAGDRVTDVILFTLDASLRIAPKPAPRASSSSFQFCLLADIRTACALPSASTIPLKGGRKDFNYQATDKAKLEGRCVFIPYLGRITFQKCTCGCCMDEVDVTLFSWKIVSYHLFRSFHHYSL